MVDKPLGDLGPKSIKVNNGLVGVGTYLKIDKVFCQFAYFAPDPGLTLTAAELAVFPCLLPQLVKFSTKTPRYASRLISQYEDFESPH